LKYGPYVGRILLKYGPYVGRILLKFSETPDLEQSVFEWSIGPVSTKKLLTREQYRVLILQNSDVCVQKFRCKCEGIFVIVLLTDWDERFRNIALGVIRVYTG
jgi:hypothetical protein